MTLKQGTTLQSGKYIIKKVLGQGGFGITYLAEHDLMGTSVAIKEFFMKDFCNRDESTYHVTIGLEGGRELVIQFKEKFLKEARNIARLHHPNIIRISDVFEENGTAYYVMDYCEKGSLADLLMLHSTGLDEVTAVAYIRQVASALQYIHERNMNHLDVKPANILLDEQDHAILIDFGLSKQYDIETGLQTSTTIVGISHGYAPMEQYKIGGVREFSPATDVYSLGATLFTLVSGQVPPSASDVLNEGLPVLPKVVSKKILATIMKSMKPRKVARLQTVQAFLNMLLGTLTPEEEESIVQIEDSTEINEDTIVLDILPNETTSESNKEELNIESLKRELDRVKYEKKMIEEEFIINKQELQDTKQKLNKATDDCFSLKKIICQKDIENGSLNEALDSTTLQLEIEKKKKEKKDSRKNSIVSILFFVSLVGISTLFIVASWSHAVKSQMDEATSQINEIKEYCPLIIRDVEIANMDKNGNIETNFGGRIDSENSLFLYPKLVYTCFEDKTRKIKVKWINPLNEISSNDSSPAGFSYEENVEFHKGTSMSCILYGWGSDTKGNWNPGTYKLEIWEEDKCLSSTDVIIHPSNNGKK